MRSKQLLNLYTELSELNCHYSHYLFISEQFREDNKKTILSNSEEYVTTIYAQNKYSSQFNVQLKNLPQEVDATKQFIMRSYFLLCFSNLEIYCRDIYHFANHFIDLQELNTKSSPITQLIDNLSLNNSIDEAEIDTLVYLRLRRNAFIHRDSKRTARGELVEHIKANGKKMNEYWLSQEVEMEKLDFSDRKNLYNFSDQTMVEAINLIRLLAEKIDSLIIQKIGEEKLLLFIVDDFKKAYLMLSKINNPVNKFAHYALIEYGAKFDEQKISSILGE